MKLRIALKLLAILILIILNFYLIPAKGTGDVNNWLNIITKIKNERLTDLFPGCLNYDCGVFYPLTYPPGHFLVMIVISLFIINTTVNTLLTFKYSLLISYFLIPILLIFFNIFVSKRSQKKQLNIINLLLTFFMTVSVIINSQGLGYTDVFYIVPFIIALLFLLLNHNLLSGFFFGIASLIKWQPVIIFPVIIIYLLKEKNLKQFLIRLTSFLCGWFTVILVIYPLNKNIAQALIYSFFQGAVLNKILSSALNLPWLLTFLIRVINPHLYGGLSEGLVKYIQQNGNNFEMFLYMLPKLLFAVIYIWIFYIYYFKKEHNIFEFIFTCYLSFTTYFFLSSGVHENHLITSVILALILYIHDPSVQNKIMLIITDIINLINLYIFYGFTGTQLVERSTLGIDRTVFYTLIFLIFYFIILYRYSFKKEV